MEAIGMGLQAIGKAIGAWATAYAFIYIAGIGTKTFLIYTGKMYNQCGNDLSILTKFCNSFLKFVKNLQS